MMRDFLAEPFYTENDRVILRPLTAADHAALRDLFDYPLDEGRSREMARQLIQAIDNGTLVLAVLDQKEQIFRGILEVKVKSPRSLEIGYRIKKPYRHRRYASEALRLFRQTAFAEYSIEEIRARVKKDNEYSRRLLQHSGFIKTGGNGDMEEYVCLMEQAAAGNRNQEELK